MWTRQYRTRKRNRLILPLLAAMFLAYFGYHAWNGTFGLKSKVEQESRIVALTAERDALVRQRVALERRVTLLSDGTLERDMVDEQARRALNLAGARDIVILTPDH